MRTILSAVLLSAAMSTGTLVVTATPAAADTPRCVTHKEYRQVHRGMKKARVHRIFDFRGEFADGAAGGYTRFYGSCEARRIGGGDGGAYVTYNGQTGRVAEKRWIGYA
jgi:hypothetical protein